MNIRHIAISLSLVWGCSLTGAAQEAERSSSSINLSPNSPSDVIIPFAINGEGKRFTPTWGLDQAWISEQNMRKGLRHMEPENVTIGRSCFSMKAPLTDDGKVQGDQITRLRQRNSILRLAGTNLPLVLTADQEAGSDESYVKNSVANTENWARMINAHVEWMQENTQFPVAGVSPFNEPDYWSVEEGATIERHRDVARILKEQYPAFADNKIAIVGGNTLNDDKALNWYNGGKQYYDWGNTHHLAGSMANYKAYYDQLARDGKVGYNDEMHNVAEAMIGLEHGMTVGIWWGFDSRARGEFCQISRHGERIAYGEHASNWTAASVYRHDDGRVKAFVGSSERQAYTTTYQFVSTEREVYYDGHGPLHEYCMEIPGGTGYQKGQTNAERVIDVTWGEDVAPSFVADGRYTIANCATGNILVAKDGNIVLYKAAEANKYYQWDVHLVDPRIGGDYSFYTFESADNKKLRPNVLNYSTIDGTNVLAYAEADVPLGNEQWYLEYAGNGYYFIRSRETALYLSSANSVKSNGTNIVTKVRETDANRLKRQMWRFMPIGITYETVAPATPTGLLAEAGNASVRLSWTPGNEEDLDGYMILRAPKDTEQWNTIARKVKGSSYTDNTCRQGVTYIYKVKAIDLAENMSEASAIAEATPTGERGLVGQWEMDDNLYDITSNMMDGAMQATPTYTATHQSGTKALSLSNIKKTYLQLPYEIANSDELTITLWVNWRDNSSSWQRLFDFGYDTDHYLFLTPSNGKNMRFAIKNGGNELTIDCPSKLDVLKWRHVAVTIGKDKTAIYVNGEEVASSTGIDIKPSDIRPLLNYIGRSQFSSDPFLTAYIDDARIYNYALTADEVKNVMENVNSGIAPATGKEKAAPVIYGMDGIRRNEMRKGINIVNGKKQVRN